MKKLFLTFGGILLLIIISISSAVGYFAFFVLPSYDESSKEFINENIPIILSSWDTSNIIENGSNELMSAISKEDLKVLFLKFSNKLGKLKTYKGCKGDSNVKINISTPNIVTAKYIADAEFENGSAEIKVKLIQIDNKWQYLSIYVQSPLLSE